MVTHISQVLFNTSVYCSSILLYLSFLSDVYKLKRVDKQYPLPFMSAWSKLFLHHNKATDRMTAANSYYSTQLHFVSGSGLPVTHVSMWAYCYVSMWAHFDPSPSKKFSVTVVLIIPYKYTLAELLW